MIAAGLLELLLRGALAPLKGLAGAASFFSKLPALGKLSAIFGGIALVLLLAFGVQTWRLGHAQRDYIELHQKLDNMQAASDARAKSTAKTAVTEYDQHQAQDAPVVSAVVNRVRNVCLRPADHPSLPGTASGTGPTSSQAQDDADREAYVAAIGEDILTCRSELNRLDAIRNFHNANVGLPK